MSLTRLGKSGDAFAAICLRESDSHVGEMWRRRERLTHTSVCGSDQYTRNRASAKLGAHSWGRYPESWNK